MLTRSCEVGRVESTQRVRVIISWRKTRDKDEGARNTAREDVPMHSERRKYKSPEQALRETERAGGEADPHQPQQQLNVFSKGDRKPRPQRREWQALVCTAAVLRMSHESRGAPVPIRNPGVHSQG